MGWVFAAAALVRSQELVLIGFFNAFIALVSSGDVGERN